MSSLFRSAIENLAIDLLEREGYVYLSPEEWEIERQSPSEIILQEQLKLAIDVFNPKVPAIAKEQCLHKVLQLKDNSFPRGAETFRQMLVAGVNVEYQKSGHTTDAQVQLIDFDSPRNNNLLACNRFWINEDNSQDYIDILLFVNGLPLVVVEFGGTLDKQPTLEEAFNHLQRHKENTPALFNYSSLLLVSDGTHAKIGPTTSTQWSYFSSWHNVPGEKEDALTGIETFIRGTLRPGVLLDLIKNAS